MATETALLKVLADIYGAIDRQQVTLLGLLDLSAAFDCVDHDILLRRLLHKFGICGTALNNNNNKPCRDYSDTVTLKVFQGHFTKLYYITVSLPEKRWQTVLSSISGGTQAVT